MEDEPVVALGDAGERLDRRDRPRGRVALHAGRHGDDEVAEAALDRLELVVTAPQEEERAGREREAEPDSCEREGEAARTGWTAHLTAEQGERRRRGVRSVERLRPDERVRRDTGGRMGELESQLVEVERERWGKGLADCAGRRRRRGRAHAAASSRW